MAVLLTSDQLPALLEKLQGNTEAIHIRGEVTSKLNSWVTDYDFIVDSWPDYKAVVVRTDPKTAKYQVHLGPLISLFTTDNTALEALLQKPGVIDWSSRIIFICVAERPKPVVIKATESQHRVVKETDSYILMTLTMDTLKLSPIPSGFKLTKILPEQAHLVNSLWKFNDGEHSEIYIKDIVTQLPSCCLYNEEGNVVGFALRYHYGAIGMLHVLEEFRGKGYAKVIMSHLAYSCLQKDKEIFVLPDEENIVSIKLHESIGFVKHPHSKWFALVLDDSKDRT